MPRDTLNVHAAVGRRVGRVECAGGGAWVECGPQTRDRDVYMCIHDACSPWLTYVILDLT